MKYLKNLKLTVVLLLIMFTVVYAGDTKLIPSAQIKDLNGKIIDTKTFMNGGKPFVIDFWATWCQPCILELTNINDVYDKWQKETGVKIFAVSIDDSRNSRKVAPFVVGRNWTYDVFLDENSDFRRAMNVTNPPFTFLCNGKGEIVWSHNGYAPGDEDELYKQILILTKAEQK